MIELFAILTSLLLILAATVTFLLDRADSVEDIQRKELEKLMRELAD